MDLPEDKKQAVMNSNAEKKWQMIKDMEKRRPQLPPKEYLSKFKSVMEEENIKVLLLWSIELHILATYNNKSDVIFKPDVRIPATF